MAISLSKKLIFLKPDHLKLLTKKSKDFRKKLIIKFCSLKKMFEVQILCYKNKCKIFFNSPYSKTSRLLYSSEISSAFISPWLLLPFKIFRRSSTFFLDSLFILVCHEVEPVPVVTHRPELFVFVITCVVLGRMWRWETRADKVSPMKTYKKNIINFFNHVMNEKQIKRGSKRS